MPNNEHFKKRNNFYTDETEIRTIPMVIRRVSGRTYYSTRAEAEKVRRKGDRIYYKPGKEYGYYIVRPQKRDPWSLF